MDQMPRYLIAAADIIIASALSVGALPKLLYAVDPARDDLIVAIGMAVDVAGLDGDQVCQHGRRDVLDVAAGGAQRPVGAGHRRASKCGLATTT